jgi:chromosome segregation protein
VFLKSLTLKGFKSFADTTTLEFEPGVTVVVGPNGSGKSNIVDAVAWVLGAQGPRTLRSSKMEDVIFAGTPKRAALGRAEVSLTIDNSAGLLPIEFSEVRVTRTLWRTGESEYALNGAPCRLLDIQELLSDTGVGRQQHTIVSQSQLDAILSARPEDRRAVIEEAAGVSKHRRRKEKAERRLEATESALLRAQDLLREVRHQLRPLERQAEAARRYGDLVGELDALRRYLSGRELSMLGSRMVAMGATKAELSRSEAEVLSRLAHLDAQVASAESSLDAARREAEVADLAELVSTAEGLRARASGLAALLAERGRGVERDRLAAVDHDVVSSLEAEAASLEEQLARTELRAEELLPLEAELAAAEAALETESRALEARGPGPGRQQVAQREAEGQVRAEIASLRRAAELAGVEIRRLSTREDAVGSRQARLQEEVARLEVVVQGSAEADGPLATAAEQAAGDLARAQAEHSAAQEARRSADADRHRWSARVEALAQALDEARARAGARRLAPVEGVLGALLELVEVDEGWQAAFEAAAEEALSAVVVDSGEAARRGLAHLAGQRAAGAVIALGPARGGTPAAGPSSAPVVPTGASLLREHVRSEVDGVSELLDSLLVGAVVVEGGWEAAVDLAVAAPDLVVVTRTGDRCARGIWRTGASRTGATRRALEEAQAALSRAAGEADLAATVEEGTRAAAEAAGAARSDAARSWEANGARRQVATEALRRVQADLDEATAEALALASQRSEVAAMCSRQEARAAELDGVLPELEAANAEAERQAEARRVALDRLAERATAVSALRRDFEVRAAGIEERRAILGRRLGDVEARLAGSATDREKAALRRTRLDVAALATARLAKFVGSRVVVLERALEALREARRHEAEALRGSTEQLDHLRRERAGVERELSALRESSSRADLEEAELRTRLEVLTETVRRELDCEPESLEGTECPPLPAGTSAPSRARELERELRLMGPVNPLALEEFAALQERHAFLESQLHDVQSARRELAKVIKAVDAEIITVFRGAYEDVAENFGRLFATLFPGGEAALFLTDPSNLLESGVDIEVRPVGKNIRRLSLLSGGERSLVALAFLFAVFRSRPSPFYMMDEVESALDDVNLHRFLDLVHEFRSEAQLLVVSHQKRTMEAADCLYGVTMAPGGSSKVVSERVERAGDAGGPAVRGDELAGGDHERLAAGAERVASPL